MNQPESESPEKGKKSTELIGKIDKSAILTVIGILLLFSTSISVVLIAPRYVDSAWTSPTSDYQVQMYEIEDPHVYISSTSSFGSDLQYVHHLIAGFTLSAFKESENLRLVAPQRLEKFITRYGDPTLKLTSKLLLLKNPENEAIEWESLARKQLQQQWESQHPSWQQEGLDRENYHFMELYDPGLKEAFSSNPIGGSLQNWVDAHFMLLDETLQQPYHGNEGVVYVLNPLEYRVKRVHFASEQRPVYAADGEPIKTLAELKSPELGFHSRQELIYLGEHIYAIEGCWYCHTDQTRTLVQDVVLNGSDSFPAPASSPNEYIYQKITFPGTRRIGPDISRVGIKRPSRDWHKAHFWSPKTASVGSIMPAFQHFFDDDPRGTGKSAIKIPNHRFEAIYQYLMTKGTRITPPTAAWWLGRDTIRTKEIIEGERTLR